jgi:hypothetical protein
MGIDQQTAGTFRHGTELAENLFALLAGTPAAPGRSPAEAEESARLRELEARRQAHGIVDRADSDAATHREEREARRASANAAWGASGLAMSGSKALLRETARIRDEQDEEDLRAQGEEAARDTLDQGRAAGNMTRINGSAAPLGSTLSLGSKIYKYGR